MPRANKSKRDELTLQQRKFVNAYLRTGVGKNAAIEAGYSEKSADSMGSQLLKNPKIKKAIEVKEKQFELASYVTKENVLSGILDIANDKDATNSEKLNAFKLLGQHLAMFTDKQIIQSEQSNPFEGMTDDELAKIYEEQNRFKNKA